MGAVVFVPGNKCNLVRAGMDCASREYHWVLLAAAFAGDTDEGMNPENPDIN